MKEETLFEKFNEFLLHILYIVVKPIYLFSIKAETLEDYAEQMCLESMLFHSKDSAKFLEDYMEQTAFYFSENPEQRKKVENLIEALKVM